MDEQNLTAAERDYVRLHGFHIVDGTLAADPALTDGIPCRFVVAAEHLTESVRTIVRNYSPRRVAGSLRRRVGTKRAAQIAKALGDAVWALSADLDIAEAESDAI